MKLADEVFYENLKKEISFNKRGYEVSNEKLGELLNCHSNTVSKKMQNPNDFTLWELKQLVRTLKIKPNTLIAYLYGECK